VYSPTVGLLLLGLGLISVIVAFSDVVADRWMVLEGQRHQRGNVYQSAQWVGWGSTAMAMFLVGGWLADRMPLNQVFDLSTMVPAMALVLVIWKWPDAEKTLSQRQFWPNRSQGSDQDAQLCPGDSLKNPGILATLVNAFKQSDLRRVLGLVVLLHLSPLPIDYLYQVQELGFDNHLVGQLKATETLGTALGALGFGLWAWRSSRLPLIHLAVIGQAGVMLSPVALSAATTSAHSVYLLRGACAIISFLGLFGRVVAVCPPQVAG